MAFVYHSAGMGRSGTFGHNAALHFHYMSLSFLEKVAKTSFDAQGLMLAVLNNQSYIHFMLLDKHRAFQN